MHSPHDLLHKCALSETQNSLSSVKVAQVLSMSMQGIIVGLGVTIEMPLIPPISSSARLRATEGRDMAFGTDAIMDDSMSQG